MSSNSIQFWILIQTFLIIWNVVCVKISPTVIVQRWILIFSMSQLNNTISILTYYFRLSTMFELSNKKLYFLSLNVEMLIHVCFTHRKCLSIFTGTITFYINMLQIPCYLQFHRTSMLKKTLRVIVPKRVYFNLLTDIRENWY